jgi:hypothetical protein
MIKFLLSVMMAALPATASAQATTGGDTHVDLTISGGHDTVGEDRGRPVILIAAALKIPDQVFRDAFKGVHPSGPNSGGPSEAEARSNKQVLMDALGPYGVTNDRLNEVSNYYRYRRSAGEMWKNTPAKAYAVVHSGTVTSVVITDPGAGYSSPPTIAVPGLADVKLAPTLSYGTDLATNGSIKEIKIAP